MRGLSDTSPEAERVMTEAFRAMSPARKWEILVHAYRNAFGFHQAGMRMRDPLATPRDVLASWRGVTLGPGPWESDAENSKMSLSMDQMIVLREVLSAFAKLGIPFALGGSIASSIHGIPRYTQDADLTVEPFPGQEAQLVACFGPEFYVSLDAVRQAIRERSTFNIIQPALGFKVDVFVRRDRPFERSLLARRTPSPVLGPDEPPLDLVSAEDIILLKLEWFRLGGEVSDRQWSDILGVLRVRAEELDQAYLDHWAAELKVSDLLAKARDDAAL